MSDNIEKFISELKSMKSEGKEVGINIMIDSNIISGKLVDISSTPPFVILTDISQNGRTFGLGINMTFALNNVRGWGYKIIPE